MFISGKKLTPHDSDKDKEIALSYFVNLTRTKNYLKKDAHFGKSSRKTIGRTTCQSQANFGCSTKFSCMCSD